MKSEFLYLLIISIFISCSNDFSKTDLYGVYISDNKKDTIIIHGNNRYEHRYYSVQEDSFLIEKHQYTFYHYKVNSVLALDSFGFKSNRINFGWDAVITKKDLLHNLRLNYGESYYFEKIN